MQNKQLQSKSSDTLLPHIEETKKLAHRRREAWNARAARKAFADSTSDPLLDQLHGTAPTESQSFPSDWWTRNKKGRQARKEERWHAESEERERERGVAEVRSKINTMAEQDKPYLVERKEPVSARKVHGRIEAHQSAEYIERSKQNLQTLEQSIAKEKAKLDVKVAHINSANTGYFIRPADYMVTERAGLMNAVRRKVHGNELNELNKSLGRLARLEGDIATTHTWLIEHGVTESKLRQTSRVQTESPVAAQRRDTVKNIATALQPERRNIREINPVYANDVPAPEETAGTTFIPEEIVAQHARKPPSLSDVIEVKDYSPPAESSAEHAVNLSTEKTKILALEQSTNEETAEEQLFLRWLDAHFLGSLDARRKRGAFERLYNGQYAYANYREGGISFRDEKIFTEYLLQNKENVFKVFSNQAGAPTVVEMTDDTVRRIGATWWKSHTEPLQATNEFTEAKQELTSDRRKKTLDFIHADNAKLDAGTSLGSLVGYVARLLPGRMIAGKPTTFSLHDGPNVSLHDLLSGPFATDPRWREIVTTWWSRKVEGVQETAALESDDTDISPIPSVVRELNTNEKKLESPSQASEKNPSHPAKVNQEQGAESANIPSTLDYLLKQAADYSDTADDDNAVTAYIHSLPDEKFRELFVAFPDYASQLNKETYQKVGGLLDTWLVREMKKRELSRSQAGKPFPPEKIGLGKLAELEYMDEIKQALKDIPDDVLQYYGEFIFDKKVGAQELPQLEAAETKAGKTSDSYPQVNATQIAILRAKHWQKIFGDRTKEMHNLVQNERKRRGLELAMRQSQAKKQLWEKIKTDPRLSDTVISHFTLGMSPDQVVSQIIVPVLERQKSDILGQIKQQKRRGLFDFLSLKKSEIDPALIKKMNNIEELKRASLY